MKTTLLNPGFRWLTLAGYVLVVALFGNRSVLCEGADGHVAIEPYHGTCCPVSDSGSPFSSSDGVSADGCCTDSYITSDQVGCRDQAESSQFTIAAPLLSFQVVTDAPGLVPVGCNAVHPPDTLGVTALSIRSVRLLV